MSHPVSDPIPVSIPIRTKGSCVGADPDGHNTSVDLGKKCLLFVDGVNDPVTLGMVYSTRLLVNEQPLLDDISRVSVVQVITANMVVPMPTEEVFYISQALQHFLMWPTLLLKIVTNQGKSEVLAHPQVDPIQQLWSVCVEMYDTSAQSDLSKITNRTIMLNISILQLKEMFMYDVCVTEGKDDTYRFLEPASIQRSGNKPVETQTYIQNWMSKSNKRVYLAPYIAKLPSILLKCLLANYVDLFLVHYLWISEMISSF